MSATLAGALDVTDERQWAAVVTGVVADCGRVDVPGSTISTSSVPGKGGGPGRIPYQASTSAIDGMTRTAAIEVAGTGVRVNAIVPGWVDTQTSSTEASVHACGTGERRW